MANKVNIFIHNSKGNVFVLSNDRMSIMMASKHLNVNWKAVFPDIEVGPFDLILSEWSENTNTYVDRGYTFVEHCEDLETAEKLIEVCRKTLNEQYNRMMTLRVAKRNGLDERMITNLELAYHNPENYDIYLNKLL